MTSAELLVDAFGRIRQLVHRVVAGLTPEQLAFRAVCPASDDVSDIFQPTGSLLVTAVGRGAVADLRRQRQAAVAAAGAAVLVTTTASSASTLQGISHARNATGHKLLTAGSAPMPVASAPHAATVAACGSGGAGWPGCSASKACQQNEKAQHTSVQCRRIARRFLTWKSAQPSSSQPIWSVAGQRVAVGPSPARRDIPLSH